VGVLLLGACFDVKPQQHTLPKHRHKFQHKLQTTTRTHTHLHGCGERPLEQLVTAKAQDRRRQNVLSACECQPGGSGRCACWPGSAS
jgi:hypothetical protein